MKEDKTMYYPTCRFCGNQQLPTSNYISQEQADESATLSCNCDKARDYRFNKDQENERLENIKRLETKLNEIEDYCLERNFDMSNEVSQFILNMGVLVLDGKIQNVSLKIRKFKIGIKANNKNGLAISYSYNDKVNAEV